MDPSFITQTAPYVSSIILTYLGKEQLNLILGPTSKYIGEGLLENIKKVRVENIANILKQTSSFLGKKLEQEGGIPPRYISCLLNEGSYIDDLVVQTYFAGILASARTPDIKNDRGLIYLDIINKLSHYDIRAHNYLYSSLRDIHMNNKFNFYDDYERAEYGIWVNKSNFLLSIVDEQESGYPNEHKLILEIMNRLESQSLISKEWTFYEDQSEGCWAVTFVPTVFGAQLFLWAYGKGDWDVIDLFNSNITFETPIEDITNTEPMNNFY